MKKKKKIMIKVLFICHGRVRTDALKTCKSGIFQAFLMEFTALLRQLKSGYDNNVVKEVKAMKERITENGIDYVLVGDYYIPDLRLPEENRPIGKYGFLHKEYLKERHPGRYTYLVLSCQLWKHLADVNEQVQARVERVIQQMQEI